MRVSWLTRAEMHDRHLDACLVRVVYKQVKSRFSEGLNKHTDIKETIKVFSSLQRKSITLCCQQHQELLDNSRPNYLIRYSPDVGIGCILSSIVFENYKKDGKEQYGCHLKISKPTWCMISVASALE